ncbi:MAG TPA: 30S ribosomal protein S6 [Dehalococcoidia bacterium]|nr:30S ribosomal protein S6 [Dehalococcoidia bacterium]
MREYELAVVISPDVTDEQAPEAYERVRQMVTSRGGEVVNEDVWGRKKLAYPIGKHLEGNYLFTDIKLPAERVRDLESGLQISEEVLRHMLIRKDD